MGLSSIARSLLFLKQNIYKGGGELAHLEELKGTQKLSEAWPKIERNSEALNAELAIQDLRINNIVADAGNSNVEIVDARVPEEGTAYPTLKDRLDTERGELVAQLADIAINVKTYGAKGDGLTDDSLAFREANLYGYNKKRISNVQLIPTNSMQIFIPNGIYRVKGNHIFGSPIPQGQASLNIPAIAFKVIGDNATIIWEIENVNDELFYFDGTITMPQIKGLTIIPVSENQTIPIGGTIFKYYQNLPLGYADASKGNYEDISVWSGRATSNPNYGTKIKNVFHNVGNAMSDQTIVQNCRFNYFETLYKGENQEGVNWTFDSCGFYAGGFANSVYFDFTSMGDNFNVQNSSFSVASNETMLRNRSTIVANKFTQAAHYNFNFLNNRIELYGNIGTSWKLCDMNFGRFNFSGTNLRLASGSGNVKTIVAAYGLANINFDNIIFNEVLFLLPIATSEAINGAISATGAILKFCDLISGKYTLKYYDGISEYSIKDVLISSSLFYKSLLLENCTNANGNSYIDFEITNNQSGVGVVRRTDRTINLSRSGVALGNTFTIPPYQTIKNIKLTGLGTVPATFDKFRIYFGDKSLNNYLDVPNPKPSTEVKNEMMLWEGLATIFNDDTNLQSVTVYILDNGIETGSVRSQISLSYEPLDPLIFGITTIANTIQIKTKSKTIASGNTAGRPSFGQYTGQQYFDTSIGKLICWDGAVWVDKMSRFVSVPVSASATGNVGDWSADSGFLYLCHAINTWKRVAIATW